MSPPTGSGISAVPKEGGGGLGTGAKAGIGVAVVVGSGIIVGAATWFCLRRYKRRRRARSGVSGGGGGGGAGSDGAGTVTGMVLGTGEPTGSSVGRRRREDGSLALGVGRGEMSESHSDIVSHGGRLRGLTQDYFGPDAVAGPYTETSYYDTTPATADRAVPTAPHGPDDIAAPVEIDSRTRYPVDRSTSVGTTATNVTRPPPVVETIEGRVELSAPEPLPSSGAVSPYIITPSPGVESAAPTEGQEPPKPRAG